MTTWQLPVTFGVLLVLLPMIWRRPVLGVYVLVGAAVAIENFGLGFPDALTDEIPFFWNLNNSIGAPISMNPAEVVMIVTILGALTNRELRQEERPAASRLRGYYLVFLAVVVFAEGFGLMNGGNFNISLWEMRPQVYGFILFVLASTLIRDRRQVAVLAGVVLACAAFKAGIGFYRYFFTLAKTLGTQESILGHEDSYFLAMFIVAAVTAAIWVRRRQVVLPLLLAAPVVALVMLDNRRRIAVLALGAAIAIVVILGIRYEAAIRKRLAVIAIVGALAFGAFVTVNWNAAGEGVAAQIVRPLHAITGQVDQRDFLSDLYRINENKDIIFTFGTSPIVGTGFGHVMLLPYPLADISQLYPLWNYIPHNSLLWVGMRMGIIGMATFWALIAMIVLEGIRALRSVDDPLLRGAAAFAVAAAMAELVVGYADVQLEAYRNMIFFGAMVGLIDALPRLRAITVARPAAVRRPAPAPALRPGTAGTAMPRPRLAHPARSE
jgi:hypothetical protein